MNPQKVDVTDLMDDEVAWTLLATLYLRAWESRAEGAILGDRHAAETLDRLDYDFAPFQRRLQPRGNQFLVALRARQLDDWSAGFLSRHPDATVLHLGCGLDSRVLRLDPPPAVRWLDLDTPEVIAVRRRLFSEHDGYRMIGSSVTDPEWLAEVPGDRPVLVVAEGLLPYLEECDVRGLFQRLADHFGSGEVIFDGVAPWLARMMRAARWGTRDGSEIERWDPRLTRLERVPFTTHHATIPVRRYRALYRLGNVIPGWRRMSQDFRFAIGANTGKNTGENAGAEC